MTKILAIARKKPYLMKTRKRWIRRSRKKRRSTNMLSLLPRRKTITTIREIYLMTRRRKIIKWVVTLEI